MSSHAAAVDSFQGRGGAGSEIMLFGVRVKVDPMRKCVSLNDLSEYAHHPQPQDVPPNAATDASVAAGYASADDANHQLATSGSRERKRGIPWSEEEHKLFLLGLQNAGKGDWRGISRNFVKTRTPTQVASHAQKYFLRRSNLNKRRRRSSLFDITSESVAAISMEKEKVGGENTNQFIIQPPKETTLITDVGSQVSPIHVCHFPLQIENDDVNNESSRSVLVQPMIPFLQTSNSRITTTDLNSMTHHHFHHNPLISLDLSLSSGQNHLGRNNNSSFQMGPNLNNGKSIISVA